MRKAAVALILGLAAALSGPASAQDDDDLSSVPCPSFCDERQIGNWKFSAGFPLWMKGEPRPERSWSVATENAQSEALTIGCQHGNFNLSVVYEGSGLAQTKKQVPFYIVTDYGRFRFGAWGERQDDPIGSLDSQLVPVELAGLRSAVNSIMIEFVDRSPLLFPARGAASAISFLMQSCR